MCATAPIRIKKTTTTARYVAAKAPVPVEDMDVGSSAPSTPTGSSSGSAASSYGDPVPYAAALHHRPRSAAQQMPLPFAATMRARAPAPAPVKMMPARQEVPDAGSTAPSSPTDSCSESSASSYGAMSASSQETFVPYAAELYHQMPPLPFAATAPPRVEVRQVWAHNFDREAKLIESLLRRFPYLAVDTEFPGTVYRPASPAYMLTPEKRYALLRANVNELELIQLGITLFDDDGRLPTLAGGATRYVWEFKFREFDLRRHRHAPESIALLRSKGLDFDRTREHGVSAAAFGPRLRKWLRAGLGRAGVVTFSGGYDLAYLVKTMFGGEYKLPATAAEFEGIAQAIFQTKLFDVKEMARCCPGDLRGGLESLAGKLNLKRAVGEAHQAGSDSLLTCQTFATMRKLYFGDDDKLTRVAGMLAGVASC